MTFFDLSSEINNTMDILSEYLYSKFPGKKIVLKNRISSHDSNIKWKLDSYYIIESHIILFDLLQYEYITIELSQNRGLWVFEASLNKYNSYLKSNDYYEHPRFYDYAQLTRDSEIWISTYFRFKNRDISELSKHLNENLIAKLKESVLKDIEIRMMENS